MKTPEEIKMGLECCAEVYGACVHCPYINEACCSYKSKRDAFNYIEQLEKANSELIDAPGKLTNPVNMLAKWIPEWISTEDKMPEDDEDVLVFAVGKEDPVMAITSYTHNMYGYNFEGWRSPWEYFHRNYTITHWMPLPDSPKED